jgi:hypothetical protein
MKVRHLTAIASEIHGHDGTKTVTEHLLIVSTDGRVFERFSDDKPGVWHEVPLPERQERKRRSRKPTT